MSDLDTLAATVRLSGRLGRHEHYLIAVDSLAALVEHARTLERERDGWKRHAATSDREVANLRTGFAAVMESLALPPMPPQLMWQDGAMSIMRRTNEIVDEANRLAGERNAAEARADRYEKAIKEALHEAPDSPHSWRLVKKHLSAALAGEDAPKIEGGLISQPTRREMGVDAPDFGPLLAGEDA